MFRLTSLLIILVLFQGCSAKVSCGDLFSKYAQKPKKLKFVKCEEGTRQVLFKSSYRVFGDDVATVEKLLVEQYGLRKFSDYYHAMPENKVYITPQSLLKIDSNYTLSIEISLVDFDELALNHIGQPMQVNEFIVYVKVWDI